MSLCSLDGKNSGELRWQYWLQLLNSEQVCMAICVIQCSVCRFVISTWVSSVTRLGMPFKRCLLCTFSQTMLHKVRHHHLWWALATHLARLFLAVYTIRSANITSSPPPVKFCNASLNPPTYSSSFNVYLFVYNIIFLLPKHQTANNTHLKVDSFSIIEDHIVKIVCIFVHCPLNLLQYVSWSL